MATPSEYEIEMLTASKVAYYWSAICAELDKVPHIWDLWWTKEWLFDEAMNSRLQLWAVGPKDEFRTVYFTRVQEYPANRFLNVMLAIGNDLDNTLPLFEATMQKYAPMQGCTQATVVGRPGWEKKLQKSGFRRIAITLVAPIKKQVMQ